MNVFKNMEVVLMLAFGIVCASAAVGPVRHGEPVQRAPAVVLDAGPTLAAHADAESPMPMVHVVGRRLSADEKRAGVN